MHKYTRKHFNQTQIAYGLLDHCYDFLLVNLAQVLLNMTFDIFLLRSNQAECWLCERSDMHRQCEREKLVVMKLN